MVSSSPVSGAELTSCEGKPAISLIRSLLLLVSRSWSLSRASTSTAAEGPEGAGATSSNRCKQRRLQPWQQPASLPAWACAARPTRLHAQETSFVLLSHAPAGGSKNMGMVPELPTHRAAPWSCAAHRAPVNRGHTHGGGPAPPGRAAPRPVRPSDFHGLHCSSYKFLQPLPQRLIGAKEQRLGG